MLAFYASVFLPIQVASHQLHWKSLKFVASYLIWRLLKTKISKYSLKTNLGNA